MDHEKVFSEGSERKEAFLEQKNIGLKNQSINQKITKILHFFKGVIPWLMSENGDFLMFRCYPKRDQKIVFCEGFEGKEAFLDHKNIDSKTTKT